MTMTPFVSRPLSYNLCALTALALGACAPPSADLPASEFVLQDAASSFVVYEADGTARMRPVAPPSPETPDEPETPDGPETPDEPETPNGAEVEPEPAQVPPMWDGDFVATDDVQLEVFCADGFTSVLGSVSIGAAVANPSAMDCLESVRGDLAITFAPQVQRIDGFNDLVEIGGDLRIANLAGLDRLLGFDRLAVLEGSLEIEENRALREVHIASTLLEVSGDVMVRWNDAAEVVELLGEAWRIGGNYVLERFASAEDLPYLPALVLVQGDVLVLDNPDLQGIESLYGLERIDGNLVIDENPAFGDANAEGAGDVMADRVGGAVVLGRNGG